MHHIFPYITYMNVLDQIMDICLQDTIPYCKWAVSLYSHSLGCMYSIVYRSALITLLIKAISNSFNAYMSCYNPRYKFSVAKAAVLFVFMSD